MRWGKDGLACARDWRSRAWLLMGKECLALRYVPRGKQIFEAVGSTQNATYPGKRKSRSAVL